MEHARKLALVDPRQLEYDHLQQHQQHRHAEYRDIQKLPIADVRVKTSLSLDMKLILDDDTISDDVKAKLYRHVLDRYLKVSNTVSESPPVAINALQPPMRRKTSPSPDEGRKTTKKKKSKQGPRLTNRLRPFELRCLSTNLGSIERECHLIY